MVEQGAMNVGDVLKRVPGVQVQEANGTGGSDISLNVGVRGLTSRLSPRSTVLIDGVPAAFAPYGQPQLSMAPIPPATSTASTWCAAPAPCVMGHRTSAG